jgi:hypothetical protein
MEIKIDEDNVLLCPHCEGNYLHHGNVNVYTRYEDAEQTLHTTVAGYQTKTALVASDTVLNPSSRRGGVRINFFCELCGGESDLTLAQHKGVTFVEWGIV